MYILKILTITSHLGRSFKILAMLLLTVKTQLTYESPHRYTIWLLKPTEEIRDEWVARSFLFFFHPHILAPTVHNLNQNWSWNTWYFPCSFHCKKDETIASIVDRSSCHIGCHMCLLCFCYVSPAHCIYSRIRVFGRTKHQQMKLP